MNTSDLIQPRHLSRRAIVYVRQSTPQQVNTHQESQQLQYALRERALQLGWHEQDIEVIDADLGHTASTTEGRIGFQHLVSEVALKKVGVVMAYDATRLARNCSHWYQLLDLCGHADCLIADRDGVYDPCSINGRLLLGLKGQISEMELHTIRARLLAGKLAKAERGEGVLVQRIFGEHLSTAFGRRCGAIRPGQRRISVGAWAVTAIRSLTTLLKRLVSQAPARTGTVRPNHPPRDQAARFRVTIGR
jgi:hypothetical protein